ncbi:RNA polymerase sigma factor [Dietzia psychralcaliphila]|uniref:RNA polymerase subunit sigma-24 n=1 Tax=Dietzia psychralcaliphila TaxID=139021 RepID=A0AAD0JNC3_9ACTN|nr:sigma-70 family RNA polymerase sigma factor [Dietzia psychralcaliphila]AWH94237.1 RNA polymerase subunit sigma-24 [Dietzia psychralcaliphila]PTM87831.1 RNA polymerase sigma factor (sigma-70 family) [Dietzia psychralcaliphila]
MRAAFDGAVVRHGPTVLRVCRAVLGPGPDADDAWSETFLSALRAWPDLPEETNVEAWLVRVAHRRAVDVVRRSARIAAPAGGVDDVALLEEWAGGGRGRSGRGRSGGGRSDGGWSGSRAGDDDELGDHQIWGAVAALPTRQRLCVAYRYLGGLPYAEIAALTGGGEAAARRAAADGVAALRRTVERETVPDQTVQTTPTMEEP